MSGALWPGRQAAPLSPRPEAASVIPGIHGGTNASELIPLGLTEADIIDFSASVSPFGLPPSVHEAIANVRLEAYPDPDATALTAAISSLTGVAAEQVLVTSGSVELLQMVAQTYLTPKTRMLYLTPAFGEYAPVAQVMGAAAEGYPLTLNPSRNSFDLDYDEFVSWVAERTPAVLVLNDPHNPTGLSFSRDLFERLLSIEGELLIMVDEAYRDFQSEPVDLIPYLSSGRLLLMRSLTKSYAMAGLRIGYGLGDRVGLSLLKRCRPPWTVNSVAQAAAIAALSETEWHEKSIKRLLEEKEYLCTGLSSLGLVPVTSSANYSLVRIGEEWGGAGFLRAELLGNHMRLRSCNSFGLPDYLRVSPRDRKDNERLLVQLFALRQKRLLE